MKFQVELADFYSSIEGEEITGYHAFVIDENLKRWRYAYNRQPRQTIDEFIQEVQAAFEDNKDEDFRLADL